MLKRLKDCFDNYSSAIRDRANPDLTKVLESSNELMASIEVITNLIISISNEQLSSNQIIKEWQDKGGQFTDKIIPGEVLYAFESQKEWRTAIGIFNDHHCCQRQQEPGECTDHLARQPIG